jgi:ribonuclease D
VAWDIETSGLDCLRDRVATCQLANRVGQVLLVQLDGTLPTNLANFLADPMTRKVFHYAVFDASFMARAWNVRPANLACTKVASKLLNPAAKEHSLKALLSNYLGVTIDKSQRLSDWFAETLTTEQVEYAANDVVHLLPLSDVLFAQLEKRNLSALAEECFQHLPTRAVLESAGYGDVFSY